VRELSNSKVVLIEQILYTSHKITNSIGLYFVSYSASDSDDKLLW